MHTMRSAAQISLMVIAVASTAGAGKITKGSDYHPAIDPANFSATIDNPWFPLVPGTTYHYVEKAGKRVSDNVVTVTHDTKTIMGVTCAAVHDVLKAKDGTIQEDTYDWYAQDKDGNVWYFGEDTKEYHGGQVDTEGSWVAGVDRAQPGIIMPGNPKPGDPYRQEYGPGHAEDMGQVVDMHDKVTVPFGTFATCVMTKEWSLLEAGTEKKWYAKGVGFVRSESASKEVSMLVDMKKP